MTDIKSMNKEELKDLMVQVGEKPFRAKQIYSWLHEHLVTSYEEMGNIPGKLKEKLKGISHHGPGNGGRADFRH